MLPAKTARPGLKNKLAGGAYGRAEREGGVMRIAKAIVNAQSVAEAAEIAQKAGVCRENGEFVCAVVAALESLGAKGAEIALSIKEGMRDGRLSGI
jgi:hypothetical protein